MNNSNVAHAWTHQNKDEAKGSSFYFRGRVIYSYGPHFPIARIVSREGKPDVVLFTSYSYSNTTAKHKNHVSSAIFQPCFTVPDVTGNNHAENISYYLDRINEARERALRARSHADFLRDSAITYAEEVQAYVKYFVPILPADIALKYQNIMKLHKTGDLFSKEENAAIQNRINAAREAKLKETKRRNAAALIEVGRWQSGEIDSLPWGNRPQFDYLRINGDKVETTRGADVPLEAGRIAAALLKAGRLAVGQKIGQYRVSEVKKDHVVIGCHKIENKEIERVFN